MDLKKKTAIITGAGRGIGRQIALDLAKEGCNIFICSRSGSELEAVKKQSLEYGIQCGYLAVDLTILSNVHALVQEAKSMFGSIDILINNAGILIQDGVLNVTEAQWDQTMNVNLKASFFLAQEVLRLMIQQQSGYIINMISTAAICVPPGITSYGASKAGMIGASQALYEEGKLYGVKVSMIFPGMTDTEMLRAAGTGTTSEQWMLPEDISACVMFLLKTSPRMVIKEIVPWSTGHDKI